MAVEFVWADDARHWLGGSGQVYKVKAVHGLFCRAFGECGDLYVCGFVDGTTNGVPWHNGQNGSWFLQVSGTPEELAALDRETLIDLVRVRYGGRFEIE
jgi:hypothetical protein